MSVTPWGSFFEALFGLIYLTYESNNKEYVYMIWVYGLHFNIFKGALVEDLKLTFSDLDLCFPLIMLIKYIFPMFKVLLFVFNQHWRGYLATYKYK